ncbi:hypothetical protein [Rubellicoccus peritrichatus]|uniref:PKD domain-containing protein n=1 Tax=Rubellicoccus peritrichatus TaxID=3080537 RepID=A0AAQ3LJY3_9BACT|nr:hypothetical protein [Puniceicoccus sp. CR14]WOO43639.1 hypothetical protein RZN69_11115 [Puniceicoccus sp. CR14]
MFSPQRSVLFGTLPLLPLILLTFALNPGCLDAADGEITAKGPVHVVNPINGNEVDVNYLEFLPPGYDDPENSERKYPLILVLHGAGKNGQSGSSINTIEKYLASPENDPLGKVKNNPNALTVNVNGQDESFILISPHVLAWRYDGYQAMAVLERALEELRVDETRIYLTGVSMGGKGTWSVAASPENQAAGNYFAALLPMAANDTAATWGAVVAGFNIPVWSFHGENDGTDGDLNKSGLRPPIQLINVGQVPKITIFENTGHGGTWGKGYVTSLPATPYSVIDTSERPSIKGTPIVPMDTTVYEWLLAQRKTEPRNARPDVELGHDQVWIISEQNELAAQVSDDGFPVDGSLTMTWSKESGPGDVTFCHPNSPSTVIAFSEVGTYVVSLLVDDGERSTESTVTIEVIVDIGANKVFEQDFDASGNVEDYVNEAIDSGDLTRFDDISSEANGGTWSINGEGQLQLEKPSSSSPNDDAGIFRYANFVGPPSVARIEFDLGMLITDTTLSHRDLLYFSIGNFTQFKDYAARSSSSDLFEIWSIRGFVDSGEVKYMFRHNSTNSGVTIPADGTMHRVTWYLNASGETQSYFGPDGGMYSLDAFAASIWIDDQIAISNHDREAGISYNEIRSLRIRSANSYPFTLKIDNFEVFDTLTSSSASSVSFAEWVYLNQLICGDALELADSDGDNIPNVFEYALGLDPQSQDLLSERMSSSTHVIGQEEYLAFEYIQKEGIDSELLGVQVSDDLVNWHSGTDHIFEMSKTSNHDGTETVVIRDMTPMTENSGRFVRLMVSE